MRQIRSLLLVVLMVASFIGVNLAMAGGAAAVTTKKSVASGVWSNPAIWDPAGVPTSTEKVTVKHAVTLDVSGQVAMLQVNPGKSLTFAAGSSVTLQSKGSVVVEGTLNMVPSSASVQHRLQFTGVNESTFVGGGDSPFAGTTPLYQTDDGLWIYGAGVLNAQGTTKVAWNRTGDDASWSSSDALVVTPTGYGDSVQDESLFSSFTKGGSVPSVTFDDGGPLEQTYTAEVLNLSRNVQIYGKDATHRAHVWISSTAPQTISYVEIRYMGPRQACGAYTCDVLGRYGLHLHKMNGAQSGRTFAGLVVRDSGSHAYAVHQSHGVTLDHAISYDTFEDAYWWDQPPDQFYPNPPEPVTDHFSCDGCVAALVRSDPVFEGYRLAGFNLAAGTGNSIVNSVAVGVQGNSDSAGFVWPENTSTWGAGNDCLPGPGFVDCTHDFGAWVFENNVSHNNSGMGATVWQVNSNDHVVDGFDAYHNGKAGVYDGAYAQSYVWANLRLYANGGSNDDSSLGPHTQFFWFGGSTNLDNSPSGRPSEVRDSVFFADGRTESAMILPGQSVVALDDVNGADFPPGEVTDSVFDGYTAEAVLFTWEFHDFASSEDPHATWHLSGNDLGSGQSFFCSDEDGGAGGIDPDSFIDVDGLGTLFYSGHGSGTFSSAWNCWID